MPQVAKCLRAAGRLDEAIAMYESSRDMFIRLSAKPSGRDAVDIATVSANLASVLRTKGLLIEAQVGRFPPGVGVRGWREGLA